jgi:hypothetical protein
VRGLVITCALACAACSTTQALTPAEARGLGTRTWNGATEEVFDASWLTLIAHGYAVTDSDRVAGTLVLKRGPRTWELDVAALGTEQRVMVTPREQSTRAELAGLLDVLEEGTRAYLRAWDEAPEWKYDGRKNRLVLSGFSVAPPREWEWLDYDISHRLVTVQKKRARTGLNPTLLVELDRRRPESRLRASVQRAAGLVLGARQRLVLPDQLEETRDETGIHGSMGVLDGTVPHEVVWHAFQTVLGSSEVRLVLVCPLAQDAECMGVWAAIFASVARPPGP